MGVVVGAVDDEPLPAGKDVTGDAGIVQNPDLALEISLGDTGVKLARFAVVEEDGPPVGLQFSRRDLHQGFEDLVEGLERRDRLGYVEQELRFVGLPAPFLRGRRPFLMIILLHGLPAGL